MEWHWRATLVVVVVAASESGEGVRCTNDVATGGHDPAGGLNVDLERPSSVGELPDHVKITERGRTVDGVGHDRLGRRLDGVTSRVGLACSRFLFAFEEREGADESRIRLVAKDQVLDDSRVGLLDAAQHLHDPNNVALRAFFHTDRNQLSPHVIPPNQLVAIILSTRDRIADHHRSLW